MNEGPDIDSKTVHAIRFLSMDIVQKAKSGHPGTPMGASDMVYTLWNKFLKHNPKNPKWVDRDRLILSPGHASALLYSMLYLSGYNLSMDDLLHFRQWGSKTPGHPEYDLDIGVNMTTGPLGQGFTHGIGMAIAERWLGEHYNRPGHDIVNHYTYTIVSDGEMQEGVTSEAASLAGTLRLNKLVYLYDDNGIQIEGSTSIAFSENVARRFEAYGWQVLGPVDGTDLAAIESAISKARDETGKPSLIICKTVIGHCSSSEGTAKVHGEPFSVEEARAAKVECGWPPEPDFYIPDDVLSHTRKSVTIGQESEDDWNRRFSSYERDHPELAKDFKSQLTNPLQPGWDDGLKSIFPSDTPPMATRDASGKVLNFLVQRVHAIAGGSADLSPSTKSTLVGYGDFGWEKYCGHNIHFGVREHAMGAIAGGMSLHGGIIPYTATFLTFSDYMRPPIRLAALMGIQVVYIFTHDSIGLGEDGPTHQPIEHLMNLRGVPNLTTIRPADATETAQAWRAALQNDKGPTALIFSRQKLPILDRGKYASEEGVLKGGYTLWESSTERPDVIFIGTGSETHIALEAADILSKEGVKVRVVSLPSWELFDKQSREYKESVLPTEIKARVAIEAGTPLGWEHYLGLDGAMIGMEGYGASAPIDVLYEKFGLTSGRAAQAARDLILKQRGG
ncbi:MAG: transketolase [Thaumarchaeota archaeon]|nr:transketolase [Nitrososphaerota archaeon]